MREDLGSFLLIFEGVLQLNLRIVKLNNFSLSPLVSREETLKVINDSF